MIHTHILRVCYVCVHEIQQLNPTRIALWLFFFTYRCYYWCMSIVL